MKKSVFRVAEAVKLIYSKNYKASTNSLMNIFTESALRPIQSVGRNVYLCVCVFVPSSRIQQRTDWRLLVEECIAKIAKLRNVFGLKV